MVRFRNGWLVVVAAASLAAACGGKKSDDKAADKTSDNGAGKMVDHPADKGSDMTAPATPATPGRIPAPSAMINADLGVIPLDSEFIIGFNFDELRKSALWKQVEPFALAKAADGLAKFKERCGFDPIESLQSMTLGMKNLGPGLVPDVTLIVHGPDKTKVLACIEKSKDEAKANGTELTVDGNVVLIKNTKHADGPPGALIFTDDSTAVMIVNAGANADTVKAAAAGTSTLKTSTGFVDMFSKIDTTASLWGLANGSSKVFDSVPSLAGRPKAVFGSLDVGTGLTIDAYVRFDSPEHATQIVNMGKTQIAGAKQFVTRMDLTATGADARLQVDMTEAQLGSLVQQFKGLAAQFMGAGAGGGATVDTTHTTSVTTGSAGTTTTNSTTTTVTPGSGAATKPCSSHREQRSVAASLAVALVLAVTATFSGACGKKSTPAGPPAPEVTGLAAVPATAEAVIAVDVPRMSDSPFVGRAVEQLLARDPDLASRWQRLQSSCKLDLVKQVKHVMLALGRKTGDAGNGPVLMIATGAIAETDLVACVRAMVGDGRGELTAKSVNGRTMYEAKDGNRTMFFAFGRADTVVLGSNEAFVTEAVGTGKKALDNPDLKRWIGLANQQAPIWGAGHMDETVSKGLVRATGGAVAAGPRAITMSLDAGQGATVELGMVMANATDANALESFAKAQLSLLGYAAQAKGLGKLVDKIVIAKDPTLVELVHFKIALTIDEVNQLLSVLDGGGAPPQDAGP